jgi:NAD-dependent deacetylase
MPAIRTAISACDLFVVIGSSGSVYPAAGFVTAARGLGIATLSINLEEPSRSAA